MVKQSASSAVSIIFRISQVSNLAHTAVQERTRLKRVKHRAKSVELASMALEMAVMNVLQVGTVQM